jgi:hypothetical protein
MFIFILLLYICAGTSLKLYSENVYTLLSPKNLTKYDIFIDVLDTQLSGPFKKHATEMVKRQVIILVLK